MGNAACAPTTNCFASDRLSQPVPDDCGSAGMCIRVAVELCWSQRSAVRLIAATRDERRALWTTPIASLKAAVLSVLQNDDSGDNESGPLTARFYSSMLAHSKAQQPASEKDTPSSHSIVLAVLACARCGQSTGCACGWRAEHRVSLDREALSLAQLLPRILPNATGSDLLRVRSIGLKMCEAFAASQPLLTMSVQGFKIVDPMVESRRAVFLIEISHGERRWSVTRRYSEFAALHAAVSACTSGAILPPSPPATWFRWLNEEFLIQRQRALSQYISSLALIDSVCCSVAFLSFIGVACSFPVKSVSDSVPVASEVMHLRVLQYYARPGDLVLFQSHGVVSSIQRSLTASEWDHVGIIVPRSTDDPRKGLLLLEATGDGVSALSLTSRLFAYSTYHTRRMALRQLSTPLISDSVRGELLARFRTQVDGMPYGLSVCKVLRTSETNHAPQNFFCSELVADALKALGVITTSIPSSNFWPSSFTAGAFVDAELRRCGVALGRIVEIDCRVLEVALSH